MKKEMLNINYYKMDSSVLRLDPGKKKDATAILFNHLLMRKENIQRLTHGTPRGHVKLSVRVIADDLDISVTKAHSLVKEFMELGIIDQVDKSKTKGVASTYIYKAAAENNWDFKDPNAAPQPEKEMDPGIVAAAEPKDDLFGFKEDTVIIDKAAAPSTADVDVDADERVQYILEHGLPVGKTQVQLVLTYDLEVLKAAVERTIAQGGRTFSYLNKVYSGVKKEIAKEKKEIANGKKEMSGSKEDKQSKKLKTRFHNINESFSKYDPDELEKLLKNSQKNKFKPNEKVEKVEPKKTKFHNFQETFTKYSPDELEEIAIGVYDKKQEEKENKTVRAMETEVDNVMGKKFYEELTVSNWETSVTCKIEYAIAYAKEWDLPYPVELDA